MRFINKIYYYYKITHHPHLFISTMLSGFISSIFTSLNKQVALQFSNHVSRIQVTAWANQIKMVRASSPLYNDEITT